MRGFEDLNVWIKSKQLAVVINRAFQNNLTTLSNELLAETRSIPAMLSGLIKTTEAIAKLLLHVTPAACRA